VGCGSGPFVGFVPGALAEGWQKVGNSVARPRPSTSERELVAKLSSAWLEKWVPRSWGCSAQASCRSATLEFRFVHRNRGGDFNPGASAVAGAGATEWAVVFIGEERLFVVPATNKSLKFVPGLAAVHRTALSGRRLAIRYVQ